MSSVKKSQRQFLVTVLTIFLMLFHGKQCFGPFGKTHKIYIHLKRTVKVRKYCLLTTLRTTTPSPSWLRRGISPAIQVVLTPLLTKEGLGVVMRKVSCLPQLYFHNFIQGSQASIRNYFTTNVQCEKITTSIPRHSTDHFFNAVSW